MAELETLRRQILDIFVERFATRIVSVDLDLLEERLVDSVRIVDLVFEIEQRCGVELPFDELDIEDFRTVSRLAERIAHAAPALP